MKLVNNQLAVKVRLAEPTDNGFLVLAAEIGGWAGPLALPSRARRRLLARIAALCEKLAARDEVAGGHRIPRSATSARRGVGDLESYRCPTGPLRPRRAGAHHNG